MGGARLYWRQQGFSSQIDSRKRGWFLVQSVFYRGTRQEGQNMFIQRQNYSNVTPKYRAYTVAVPHSRGAGWDVESHPLLLLLLCKPI